MSLLLSLGHPLPKQYLIDIRAALSVFAGQLDEWQSAFREAFQVEGAAASVKACRHTRSVRLGKCEGLQMHEVSAFGQILDCLRLDWIVFNSTGWSLTCYMAEAGFEFLTILSSLPKS